MRTRFKASFTRDLRSIDERVVLDRVRNLIDSVEQAARQDQIPNLKKLRGAGRNYRVRLGDYRLGLIIEGDLVTFVRVLRRNQIYRYFP